LSLSRSTAIFLEQLDGERFLWEDTPKSYITDVCVLLGR